MTFILIHESSHFLGFALIRPFIEVGRLVFLFLALFENILFHSQSPTGIGHQYVPNGIQHNPGAFQPNQPQLVAYPQQAQAPAPASQGTGLVQAQKLQFLSAAPLGVLGAGAAPVDCPRCGVRAVTRTSYVSGNTTQFVLIHIVFVVNVLIRWCVRLASGLWVYASACVYLASLT